MAGNLSIVCSMAFNWYVVECQTKWHNSLFFTTDIDPASCFACSYWTPLNILPSHNAKLLQSALKHKINIMIWSVVLVLSSRDLFLVYLLFLSNDRAFSSVESDPFYIVARVYHVAAASVEVTCAGCKYCMYQNLTVGQSTNDLKTGYLATAMKQDSWADFRWPDPVDMFLRYLSYDMPHFEANVLAYF